MRKAPIIRAVVVGLVILMAAPAGKSEQETVPRKKLSRPVATRKPKPYQVGLATWYGERHHGRTTANGELYDMFQMTAAHARLPMGSLVRVTNLRSLRSVVVRINDRGPAPANMIIDLSYGAARQLGIVRRGTARVRLDLIGSLPEIEAANRVADQAH